MKQVHIYTDGACRGNPGVGGWGAVLRYGDHERELFGAETETTNNRMELTAALEALASLREPCQVELTTDSEYLRKGMTEWLPAWKARHWKTAAKKPVKNVDIWQALEKTAAMHQISWHWVKGHSGHPENERADLLANFGIDQLIGGGSCVR